MYLNLVIVLSAILSLIDCHRHLSKDEILKYRLVRQRNRVAIL